MSTIHVQLFGVIRFNIERTRSFRKQYISNISDHSISAQDNFKPVLFMTETNKLNKSSNIYLNFSPAFQKLSVEFSSMRIESFSE